MSKKFASVILSIAFIVGVLAPSSSAMEQPPNEKLAEASEEKNILQTALAGATPSGEPAEFAPIGIPSANLDSSSGDMSEDVVSPLIINGSIVGNPNPYPWFAFLFIASSPGSNSGTICGSSLIDPSWLLTAAHCVENVYDNRQVFPFLGITTQSNLNVNDALGVAQVISHPNYNNVTFANDIALIKLSSPVPANKANPVGIGDSGSNTNAGTSARAIGFGRTSNSSGSSIDLRQGDMVIRAGPGQPCGEWGTQYDPAKNICANGRTPSGAVISVCRGDSGGPLFVGSGNAVRVLGLTSYGSASQCDSPTRPPVFARTSAFRTWLAQYVTSLPPLASGNPIGNMEAASQSGPGAISVAGWTIDPDTKDAIDVHVYVGGRYAGAGKANAARADVGRAYPWFGPNHGYSLTVPASVGGRQPVCVYAINAGPGTANTLLGCRNVNILAGNPIGNMEAGAQSAPGKIRVAGWTLDPDVKDPISVHVYANGRFVGASTANVPRSDVGSAYPWYGPNHGYSFEFNSPGGSPVRTCVYAINTGPGSANTELGCRNVAVRTGNPIGSFDGARVAGPAKIRVLGWALDFDTVNSVGVHVYVDGRFAGSGTANALRSDVGRAYPGYGNNHGYDIEVPAAGGNRSVCVYALNAGAGNANTLVGCRNVSVPTGNPIGNFEATTQAGPGRIAVSGWALDYDTDGAVPLHVYVDGKYVGNGSTNVTRNDVVRAHPGFGTDRGFNFTVPFAGETGARRVCVFAINVGRGSTNPQLGCKNVNVRTGSPFGQYAEVTQSGLQRVTVKGWAVDPDTLDTVTVRVTVDGTDAGTTLASKPWAGALDGVGAEWGKNRGFETVLLNVANGTRQVCATAVNLLSGADTPLGCKTVTVGGSPIGTIAATGTMTGTMSGWALDPDTASAVTVRVKVNGVVRSTVTANKPNSDVLAAHPTYGANHGYSTTVPLGPGSNTICIEVTNVGVGETRDAACTAHVNSGNPIGSFDAAGRVNSTTLSVSGWALDPDTNSPLTVHVYVDGAYRGALTADKTRSDVSNAYPGFSSARGYSGNVAAGTGSNRNVCVFALNAGAGTTNTLLGCRTVT